MNPKDIAGFLLKLLDTATISASEPGLAMGQATRSMLKCIQSGEFVIVTAAPPQGSAPPPPGSQE